MKTQSRLLVTLTLALLRQVQVHAIKSSVVRHLATAASSVEVEVVVVDQF